MGTEGYLSQASRHGGTQLVHGDKKHQVISESVLDGVGD